MTAADLRTLRRVAYGSARAQGVTREDAEDAAQDAIEGWLREDAVANPPAWLLVVARRRALSLIRRRQVAERFMLALVPPPAPGPEETALEALERSRVRAAVAGLPLRQRQVTALRMAGYQEAETAAVLGISAGAVKSHAARAKANLRKELEPRVIADGRQDVTLTGSQKEDTWT